MFHRHGLPITRSKTVAEGMLHSLRSNLMAAMNRSAKGPQALQPLLMELAKTTSDDPSAAQTRGKLVVERGVGNSQLEARVLALPVGVLSESIETPEGLHLVLRIE